MRIPVFLLSVLVLWQLPMQADARYSAISVESNRFCGLLQTGQLECTALNNPEPFGFQDFPDTTYTAIDLSFSYSCGISINGELACWGAGSDGELSPPVFDNPVVSLSQSVHHACALDSAGVVKCWGQNVHGQASAPTSVTDFVDVDTFGFYNSCGVRSNGEVLCWGRFSDLFLPVNMNTTGAVPFTDIEYTPRYSTDIGCGLRSDGTADCWRQGSSIIVAQFRDGPYSKLFPLTEDQSFVACALTVAGEIDCVEQSGSLVRLAGTYQDVDQSQKVLYGYTTEGRLEPVNDSFAGSQSLSDIVNGEMDMPSLVITGGEYYGEIGTELFFNQTDLYDNQYRNAFDTEVLRDGEVIAVTDNLGSFIDREPVPGEDHLYTIRSVHQFGQKGEESNAVSIPAYREESPVVDNNLNVDRPFAPQNLRGEVYWYDVELFWDRDFTNTVRNYEIRRNGELIDTSRGTSWYDNTSENGKAYQYDVLAIGHDDAILGLNSVHIQIGPAECR